MCCMNLPAGCYTTDMRKLSRLPCQASASDCQHMFMLIFGFVPWSFLNSSILTKSTRDVTFLHTRIQRKHKRRGCCLWLTRVISIPLLFICKRTVHWMKHKPSYMRMTHTALQYKIDLTGSCNSNFGSDLSNWMSYMGIERLKNRTYGQLRQSVSLSRIENAKVMDDSFNQHVLHVWNRNLDLQNE